MNTFKTFIHHGRDLKQVRETVEREVNQYLAPGHQVVQMHMSIKDIGDETEYIWLVAVALVVVEVQAI